MSRLCSVGVDAGNEAQGVCLQATISLSFGSYLVEEELDLIGCVSVSPPRNTIAVVFTI